MRFGTSRSAAAAARADLVVVPVPQTPPGRPVRPADPLLATLADLSRKDRFRGKLGETWLYHAPPPAASPRYLLVGTGPPEKGDGEAVRLAAARAGRRGAAMGVRHLAILLPARDSVVDGDPARLAQALAEGVILGTYRFDRYRSAEDRRGASPPSRVTLLAPGGTGRQIAEGMRRGVAHAEAANFARGLVDEPAAAITPLRMAAVARQEARRVGLRCRVLRLPELRRLGMGGLLGVSQGSAQEPCLIHLTYRPRGGSVPRVVLVGKGITFDSGGLSLKTAQGMETMKADKAGAAAVLAILRALPSLGIPVQVDGLLAMSENLPSGTAQKPGDILRMHSGKTVEVTNTDAEGRLVLADALAYASRLRPHKIVDLATLTGACVVALGPLASGVMGNDPRLVEAILEAARAAGEKMWPLPLYDDYLEMMKSPVADLKNSGERWGGALTAGLFLREFVPAGAAWAHLDIAGPAFLDRERGYLGKGATGAAVRTLLQYLEALS